MINDVSTAPAYAIGQALEMISEGALIVDGERKVIYANPAFASITGYRRRDIIGRSCTVLHGPRTDPRAVEQATLSLASGRSYRGEMLNYRKDGTPFWNALTISPLRDPLGAITHFAIIVRDVTEQKALEEELRYQANHDALTGLPNRSALAERLAATLGECRRAGRGAAVGMIDLDDFKGVNDKFGHAAGDALLRKFGERMNAVMREGDFVARLGGDEFVVVVGGLDRSRLAGSLMRIGQRLHRTVELPFDVAGHIPVSVGMSLGLALYDPPATPDPDQLIRRADAALYQAKREKGSRKRWWSQWIDPLSADGARTVDRDAGHGRGHGLDGELQMHYQPLLHLATFEVAKFEALARLKDRAGVLRQPTEFLPALNDADFAELFRRGLNHGLSWLRRWSEDGIQVGLSLNMPPVVCLMPECQQWIHAGLVEHGIDPWRLDLELLEDADRAGPSEHRRAIDGLRDLGVRVVMDDLGAGHSSLNRLYGLPFHVVKIDQRMVAHAAEDPARSVPFIGTLVRMAQRIGMKVVIEGLETPDLLEMAIALGADYGQGYVIAKPMPAEDVLAWLRGRVRPMEVDEFTTPLGRAAASFIQETMATDWARVIEAHRDWKTSFLRRAEGDGKPLNWRVIRRDDACRLGQWLHRCRAGIDEAHKPLLTQATRLHAAFHRRAAELVVQLGDGALREEAIQGIQHGDLDRLSSELLALLEQLREETAIAPTFPTRRSPREASSRTEHDASALTAREVSVLLLMAKGRSAREIAAELGIRKRTVEAHNAGIKRRLGFATMGALRQWAAREFAKSEQTEQRFVESVQVWTTRQCAPHPSS